MLDFTKDTIRKYNRPGKEWFNYVIYNYARSDLMLKIIKNCRGVNKTGDGKGRKEREKEKILDLY